LIILYIPGFEVSFFEYRLYVIDVNFEEVHIPAVMKNWAVLYNFIV